MKIDHNTTLGELQNELSRRSLYLSLNYSAEGDCLTPNLVATIINVFEKLPSEDRLADIEAKLVIDGKAGKVICSEEVMSEDIVWLVEQVKARGCR